MSEQSTQEYNAVKDYVQSVRDFSAAHPDIVYSQDYVEYNNDDQPLDLSGACVNGMAFAAKIPADEFYELWHKGFDLAGRLNKLYPGLLERYDMHRPEGYGISELEWNSLSFMWEVNLLNLRTPMSLGEVLDYIEANAYPADLLPETDPADDHDYIPY